MGNTDFSDLGGLCDRHAIDCLKVRDINTAETANWIREARPDIIFCFGFSQRLKKDILQSAPGGVIGFHPAKLPKNRGRHPIIWALALGLERTASTFFFMEEGIDSGDIITQVDIPISYEDTARSLYDKVKAAALLQIEDLLPRLENGSVKRIPQDGSLATYWRRRNIEDGRLDFNAGSRDAYNLTRALTRPYVGAHIIYRGKEVKVWRAQEMHINGGCNMPEPARVLDVKGRHILVKCRDNAILLTEHDFETLPKKGEYL